MTETTNEIKNKDMTENVTANTDAAANTDASSPYLIQTYLKDTLNQTIIEVTDDYVRNINPMNPSSPAQIRTDILNLVKLKVELHNSLTDETKWWIPKDLSYAQIAKIMARVYDIRLKRKADTPSYLEDGELVIYKQNEKGRKTRITDKEAFYEIMQEYKPNITPRECLMCFNSLRHHAFMETQKSVIPKQETKTKRKKKTTREKEKAATETNADTNAETTT